MADRFDKFTERARRGLTLAQDEALRFNNNYIGTEHLLLGPHHIGPEHLLLGLVREGEGIAAGVLESLGVSLDKVRAEVTRILSQSMPQGAAPGGRSATRTPTVDQLGIDLTSAARVGKLAPS